MFLSQRQFVYTTPQILAAVAVCWQTDAPRGTSRAQQQVARAQLWGAQCISLMVTWLIARARVHGRRSRSILLLTFFQSGALANSDHRLLAVGFGADSVDEGGGVLEPLYTGTGGLPLPQGGVGWRRRPGLVPRCLAAPSWAHAQARLWTHTAGLQDV